MSSTPKLPTSVSQSPPRRREPAPSEAPEGGGSQAEGWGEEWSARYAAEFPAVVEAWDSLSAYVKNRAFGPDQHREPRKQEWTTTALRLSKLGQRMRGLMDTIRDLRPADAPPTNSPATAPAGEADFRLQIAYKSISDAVYAQGLSGRQTEAILRAVNCSLERLAATAPETPRGEAVPARCPHCAKPYTYAMCGARYHRGGYECTLAPGHAGSHMAEGTNGHVAVQWL